MTQEEFEVMLGWQLLWNAIPTILQAIVSAVFFYMVEKWYSKVIFAYASLSLLIVGILMFISAFDVDNLGLRSITWHMFLINRVSAVIILLFTLSMFLREKQKCRDLEELLGTAILLRKIEIDHKVQQLHPNDVQKLLKQVQFPHT